jgi:prolyl-tRNA synthetase
MREVETPGRKTIEEVSEFLNIAPSRVLKVVAVFNEDKLTMVLLRGDHLVNEVKLGKLPGLAGFRYATEEEIVRHTGSRAGYLGPIGLPATVDVIADRAVLAMADFACGGNKAGYHLTGVNFGRDLPLPDKVFDVRNVVEGDPSPDGKGTLSLCRGIEVGHVFQLRTKYSSAMSCTFLDETGQSRPMEMGCYGIGVSRIVAAAIEQNHDDRGIIFPDAMAPFHVAIVAIGYRKSEAVRMAANKLHDELQAAGLEVLLDDRDERPGVMFADMELTGIPHRVTVGDRGLEKGELEYRHRRDTASQNVPVEGATAWVRQRIS